MGFGSRRRNTFEAAHFSAPHQHSTKYELSMKLIHPLQLLCVAALGVATASPVVAQTPATPATAEPVAGSSGGLGAGGGGGAGVGGRSGGTGIGVGMDASVFSCEIPMSQLEGAVAIITRAAEEKGIPMPNVLFAKDVRKLDVPQLKLRSVSPAGALSLIAAAAECDIEKIKTPDEEAPAGWKFKPKLATAQETALGLFRKKAAMDSQIGGGSSGYVSTAGADGKVPSAAGDVSVRTERGNTITLNPATTSNDFVRAGAQGQYVIGVGGAGGAQPLTPVTRVYPVGALLDDSKPESANLLLETLHAVLGVAIADDKNRVQPNFSFHGGTKLLIAKATPDAQALVEETLRAMTQNANESKTNRKSVNVRGQWKAEDGSGEGDAFSKGEKTSNPVPQLPPLLKR